MEIEKNEYGQILNCLISRCCFRGYICTRGYRYYREQTLKSNLTGVGIPIGGTQSNLPNSRSVRGFEFWTTVNKSSQRLGRDLYSEESGVPNYSSPAF